MPISSKNPITHNFRGFKVRLFNNNEILKGCNIVISTVEFGQLGKNSLLEIVWEINAEYIGYGYYPSKVLLPKMVEALPNEKTFLPGTSFPLYRKGNVLFLVVGVPVNPSKKEEYAATLMEWVYNAKISEVYIIGATKLYNNKSGDQIRFYSKRYFDVKKIIPEYIKNGLGISGEGPLLFINSDFLNMISTAMFIICEDPQDNLKYIPIVVKYITKWNSLNFNFKTWHQKFQKEYDSVELSNNNGENEEFHSIPDSDYL